ncbi:MAG: ATP-dependent zinc protease [Succinivibrio sp.]
MLLKIRKNIVAATVLIATTSLAADNTSDLSDKITHLRGTVESINGELSNQRASIGELKSEIEYSNRALKKQIFEELKAIQRQNQYVYDSLIAEHERDGGKMTIKPLRNYDLQTPDGKMILGGEEYVYVKEANATISARIDTGASQSSISANNITEFERSGKKWLRFNVVHNDRTLEIEAPYVRQIKINQSSSKVESVRHVVKLNIKIGDYSTSSEFNLIDRSKMQYALLIGRSLLTDIAVVDVSRNNVQKRADKEGLLILCTDEYENNRKNGIDVNAEYERKLRENQGGQIATPATADTQSLGTNPEKTLPSVRTKIEKAKGVKPEIKKDKKNTKKDTQTEDNSTFSEE